MKVVLDANCFIDATNSSSHAHEAMTELLAFHKAGTLQLTVSRHTLAELNHKPDTACGIALKCDVLHHFPVGAWDDQVATWDQVEGTWDDADQNQAIQQKLEKLAKAGTDIRDRGAYIDALRAHADAFITSDKQMVGSEPAKRIVNEFRLQVLTPAQLVDKLRAKPAL